MVARRTRRATQAQIDGLKPGLICIHNAHELAKFNLTGWEQRAAALVRAQAELILADKALERDSLSRVAQQEYAQCFSLHKDAQAEVLKDAARKEKLQEQEQKLELHCKMLVALVREQRELYP